jgi:hypothetical protein
MMAKVNAFPLAAKRLGDDVREPHKGMILQVRAGRSYARSLGGR